MSQFPEDTARKDLYCTVPLFNLPPPRADGEEDADQPDPPSEVPEEEAGGGLLDGLPLCQHCDPPTSTTPG